MKPYKKLKNYFRDNGIKQAEVAKLLNKGVSAFNQNINGTGGDFTIGEAYMICTQYELSAEEYFFEDRVSIKKHDLNRNMVVEEEAIGA